MSLLFKKSLVIPFYFIILMEMNIQRAIATKYKTSKVCKKSPKYSFYIKLIVIAAFTKYESFKNLSGNG